MGLISQLSEASRAAAAQDDKFWRSFVYYFELQIPRSVARGATNKFLFPLVISPESIRMSEPFAVEEAFTDGGGLFVEEQGVVARTITITGNTGWKPRQMPKPVSQVAVRLPNPSWSRDTTRRSNLFQALSGQRHFQFLQDSVFRTYGDLKNDPDTAEETLLFWHNIKDDEHWRVIPRKFEGERRSGNLLYPYEIELLAVVTRGLKVAPLTEDRGVIATLQQPLVMIRNAQASLQAGLHDLENVQGAIRQQSQSFANFFDNTTSLIEETAGLLDGTADLINLPFVTVHNTTQTALDALADVNQALLTDVNAVTSIPAKAQQSMREMVDALDVMGSYPAQYVQDLERKVAEFIRRHQLSTAYSEAALADAAAAAAPNTLARFQGSGTGPRPGDQQRAQSELPLGRGQQKYTSAFEWVLEQGDTLLNLAARFLGDARLWRYLVFFNDLRAPYLSEDRLPGTLRVGDTILIPSFAPPAGPQASLATLGVGPEESAAVQALGRDFRLSLVPNTRDQFDWVVDTVGGSVDFQMVEGVENLEQGLIQRVLTERGTDPLFRELGADRVVGMGVGLVDLETGRIRYADAVAADPRVAGVTSVQFHPQNRPDEVVAEITAEVRGFVRPERLQLSTPAA